MDWVDDQHCYQMTCGSEEAEKRVYHRVIGKRGRIWLYAVQDNPADNIYVAADEQENLGGYKGCRGFGGRTLTFQLEDGTAIDLCGPWHTNVAALKANTGINLSTQHSTFVVIGKGRAYPEHGLTPITITDVLYVDEAWTIGEFDRGEHIAQRIADRIGERLICFVKSKGGSSSGFVKPSNITEKVASN